MVKSGSVGRHRRWKSVLLLGTAVAFGAGMASTLGATAAENKFPIVLAPTAGTAWGAFGNDYIGIPGGPQPVTNDPKHPYVGNRAARGRQVTLRVADITNPILTPWSVAQMKKANDDVLRGKVGYIAPSSCMPGGVPGLHLFPGIPVYFLQTEKQITIMQMRGPELRRIYMDVPHSKTVKPSWYGESVGHYEGDTLVVDTIGLAANGPIDNWRTPHSDKLHVVERFRVIDGGKTLEVRFTVDDPVAFRTPWSAMQKYHREEAEPLSESICAENNVNYFNEDVTPIPTAARPDF